jgi:hypothetical protein
MLDNPDEAMKKRLEGTRLTDARLTALETLAANIRQAGDAAAAPIAAPTSPNRGDARKSCGDGSPDRGDELTNCGDARTSRGDARKSCGGGFPTRGDAAIEVSHRHHAQERDDVSLHRVAHQQPGAEDWPRHAGQRRWNELGSVLRTWERKVLILELMEDSLNRTALWGAARGVMVKRHAKAPIDP